MKELCIEEQIKQNYLANNGLECPGCQSSNFEGYGFELSQGVVTQKCFCTDCLLEWEEVYKLSDVILEGTP